MYLDCESLFSLIFKRNHLLPVRQHHTTKPLVLSTTLRLKNMDLVSLVHADMYMIIYAIMTFTFMYFLRLKLRCTYPVIRHPRQALYRILYS